MTEMKSPFGPRRLTDDFLPMFAVTSTRSACRV